MFLLLRNTGELLFKKRILEPFLSDWNEDPRQDKFRP